MMHIFESILHNALVYIDDILLLSESMDEHRMLLQDFLEITKNFRVMLSKKKTTVGSSNIKFLEMKTTNETY